MPSAGRTRVVRPISHNAVRDYFIAQGYPPELLAPAQSRDRRELLSNYSPFSVEQRWVVITKVDQ